MICVRCNERPVTTHQEYRHEGDYPHWPNQETDRCDRCAQALRDYANLPRISLNIVVDRPVIS